jgi:hypothetical protein
MSTIRAYHRPSQTAILVAVLVWTTVAWPVAGHGPDPTLSGSFWAKDTSLTYRWRSGEEPPSALKTAIKAGAADSNASKASRAATFTYSSSGSNPIEYGLDVTCGVNGIACFTRDVPDGFTMGFREHGHRFDWGSLKWCQMLSTPWPNGCFDVENIALDEFGHVEGLGHHVNYSDNRDYTDAVVQTVSRTKPSSGWNAHAYGRCDVATLQTTYDVPAATTKISTCLDLDTTLGLAASSTSIIPGQSVTFTATLKIATSSSYGQLSGNALASRTVNLQRRSLGGSSWTSVTAMTDGSTSGTYKATVSPTTTYEWRASYAAPSSEGLQSSASSPLTVAVGVPCSASKGTLVPCE